MYRELYLSVNFISQQFRIPCLKRYKQNSRETNTVTPCSNGLNHFVKPVNIRFILQTED